MCDADRLPARRSDMSEQLLRKRRFAARVLAALAIAACLAIGWTSASSLDQSKATLSTASHHHIVSSVHLDGIVVAAAAAALALWVARARVFRSAVRAPAAVTPIRRRGPPASTRN